MWSTGFAEEIARHEIEAKLDWANERSVLMQAARGGRREALRQRIGRFLVVAGQRLQGSALERRATVAGAS